MSEKRVTFRDVWNEVRLVVAVYLFDWAAKAAPTANPDGDDLWFTYVGWTARCVKRERERRAALLPPREPESKR